MKDSIFHSLDEARGEKNLGGKILGLSELFLQGFPLPESYYVSDIARISTGEFMEQFRSLPLDFPLILRSSANIEDTRTESLAGFFESYSITSEVELERAFSHSQHPNLDTIFLAYPELRKEEVIMNIILEPYLSYEGAGVFVTQYDALGRGYCECVQGNPLSKILHEGEYDSASLIEEGVFCSEMPNQEIISKYFLEVEKAFPDTSYQYEWCIASGQFFFLQKRPFIQRGKSKTKIFESSQC